MYHKPVAFQTHPLTQNAAFWANSLNMTAIRLFRAERDPFTLYNFYYNLHMMCGILPGCVLLVIVALLAVVYRRSWIPRRHLTQKTLLSLAALIVARNVSVHFESIPETCVQPKAGGLIYFCTQRIDRATPFVQMIKLYNHTRFDHFGICIEKADGVHIAEHTRQRKKCRKFATRIHTFQKFKGICAIRERLVPLLKAQKQQMLQFYEQTTILSLKCGTHLFNEQRGSTGTNTREEHFVQIIRVQYAKSGQH